MLKTSQTNDLRKKNLVSEAADTSLLEAAKKRIVLLCYILAIAHFSFSFSSLNFLVKFNSDISFLQNFFPRLILSILPFIGLSYFIKRSKIGNPGKIIIYVWSYAFLFFVAAWIHVWPTAIHGQPEILLYVSGINSAYLCSTWSLAALPNRFLKHIIFSLLLFIITPVLLICHFGGDISLLKIIASDLLFSIAVGVGLGSVGAKVYRELEWLRAENRFESAKYLGETLEKAIFEKQTNYLEEKLCTAYVFVIDIRNSTSLTRKYGEKWSEFNNSWLSEAVDILRAYGGTFVKSTGDGIIGAFGLFDEENIVRDLPELEQLNLEADEERWRNLTVDTYGCIEKLMNRFNDLAEQFFPNDIVSLACGLDRGEVNRGVRGGKSRQEFDIWGDKVNTASKLEAFSKQISNQFEPGSSLLVVSPYASDFLEELVGFHKVNLRTELDQSLGGIKWVIVRSYNLKKNMRKESA